MRQFRMSVLNRDTIQWRSQPGLAKLIELYERELRIKGLIDFDDMPLLAVRALRESPWIQRALLAKYPVLAIDEYQDLGPALHRMVKGLCFSTGMRLFAVGDGDQSIYSMNGAEPLLLNELTEMKGVQTVRLLLNYRSGSNIVQASNHLLDEVRNYKPVEDATDGNIFFHSLKGRYDNQANYVFCELIPWLKSSQPNLKMKDVAIIYPAAWIGDSIAHAAQVYGFGIIRTDKNSLYPRNSHLMSWLELCASWCCIGWRTGSPRFSKIIKKGIRVFSDLIKTAEQKIEFQRSIISALWSQRDSNKNLNSWLDCLNERALAKLISENRFPSEEKQYFESFMKRTSSNGDSSDMTIGMFCGHGDENDRINLSTLHSSKGREFPVVILFGMDEGRLPRRNATEREQREARRLFYVGFTRAKTDIHIISSESAPSRFVNEVWQRLEQK